MTTIIEKVLRLQDLDTFRFTYTEHLAQLASVCEEMSRDPGFQLFRQGEACRKLYLLVEGRVRLEDGSDGTKAVQTTALEEWSFFAQEPHRYSATCIDTCLLYSVHYTQMVDLLTAEPEFCWAITRHLAKIGREAGIDLAFRHKATSLDQLN